MDKFKFNIQIIIIQFISDDYYNLKNIFKQHL
jgi:hypothetical protein